MDEPKITVTIGRKVTDGNYGSADCSVCISQLPFNADEEMIQKALETSNIAFGPMLDDLRKKIANIRQEKH